MPPAAPFLEYKGTKLFKPSASSGAYFYVVNEMALDADGAPNAYHPANTPGLDHPANAGFPGGAWQNVLVADPADGRKPFVQPSGPFQGFFVAKTSLEDRTLAVTDPARYVDATRIPYLVFPGAFHQLTGTGTLGDFVAARNLRTGKTSAAIVADIGARDHPLREVSLQLAADLGGVNVNPRNGAGVPQGPFAYVVFPFSKSRPAWPVTLEQIERRVGEELARVGGWDRILALVPAH